MEETARRDELLDRMQFLYSKVRNEVKIELPPETWREFESEDSK